MTQPSTGGSLTLRALASSPQSWIWRLEDGGRILREQPVEVDPAGPAASLLDDVGRYVSLLRDPGDPGAERSARASLRTLVRGWLLGEIADDLDAADATVRVVADPTGPAALVPIELGLGRHARARLVYEVDAPSRAHLPAAVGGTDVPWLLGLFPNPTDLPTLRARTERERLETRLGDTVRLRMLSYGVDATAVAALLRRGCVVLHVAGHGTASGLLVEDDRGAGAVVTNAMLCDALSAAPELPRLVVLACCESAALAGVRAAPAFGLDELTADVARRGAAADPTAQTTSPARDLARTLGVAVVGMRYPVTDAFARRFAEQLFVAVAAGDVDLADAVASARATALRATGEASVLDAGAITLLQPGGEARRMGRVRPAEAARDGAADVLEGRADAVGQALRALRVGRHVELWGPPGVGKGACAAEIARAWREDPLSSGENQAVTTTERPVAARPGTVSIALAPLEPSDCVLAVSELALLDDSPADPESLALIVAESRGLPAALELGVRGRTRELNALLRRHDSWLQERLAELSPAARAALVLLAALEPGDRTAAVVTAAVPDPAPLLAALREEASLRGLVHDGRGPWRVDERVAADARAALEPARAQAIARAAAGHWLARSAAGERTTYVADAPRAIPYLERLGDWPRVGQVCRSLLGSERDPLLTRRLLPTLERLVAATRGGPLYDDAVQALQVARQLLGLGDPIAELREAIADAEGRGAWRTASRLSVRLVLALTTAGRWQEASSANERRGVQVERAGLGPLTRIGVEGARLEILSYERDGAEQVLRSVPQLLARLEQLRDVVRSREAADPGALHQSLLGLGWRAAVAVRDWPSALEFNRRRLASKQEQGYSDRELRLTRFDAFDALFELGRVEEAEQLLAELKPAFEHDRDWNMTGQVLMASAALQERHGRLDEAARLLRASLSYAYLPPRRADFCAHAHHNLAEVLPEQARRGERAAHLVAAAVLLVLIRDPGSEEALAALGGLAAFAPPLDLDAVSDACGQPLGDLVASWPVTAVAHAVQTVEMGLASGAASRLAGQPAPPPTGDR